MNGSFLLIVMLGAAQTGSSTEQTLVRDTRYPFDPRMPLTYVSGVAVDPSGQLYVGDAAQGTIGIYDRDGRVLKVMGGKGQGPGEFNRMGLIGLLGDTLWAVDYSLRRVSLFNAQGLHLSTLASTRDSVPWPTFPASVVPRAVLRSAVVAVRGSPLQNLLLLGPNGKRAHLLSQLNIGRQRLVLETSRAISILPYQPLDDSPLWLPSPDGSRVVVVERPAPANGSTASMRVVVHSSDGRPVFTTICEYAPMRVPDRVIREFVDRAASDNSRLFASPSEAQAAVRRSLYLPDYYSPVEHVAVDHANNVWIRMRAKAEAGQVFWLILDRTGRAARVVSGPANYKVWAAVNGVSWGVEEDEDGAFQIARYKLLAKPTSRAPFAAAGVRGCRAA